MKKIVFLSDTLHIFIFISPNSKKIKPVNPKGNQPRKFIWRTDVEAPIPKPPDAKSQPTGKDPDAGKDWRQEEKGTTEDEMVGWHHQLNGHESGKTPGVGERQGNLACCCPWGQKESDTTQSLNRTKDPYANSLTIFLSLLN